MNDITNWRSRMMLEEHEAFLTVNDILAVHAQFGRLDREKVKKAMGPNWPCAWNGIPAGEGIWEPRS